MPSFRLILSADNLSEKEVIEGYFYSGFSHQVILDFLSKYHNISLSMSTLKRRLVQYNLKRNKGNINLPDVERLIRNELDGPGKVSGYRGTGADLEVSRIN